MKEKEYILATNRGFIVFDYSLGVYVILKNVHYAEGFASIEEAQTAKQQATEDTGCPAGDMVILQALEKGKR